MCDRVTLDGELNPRLNNISLSLENVKAIFSKNFIQQLDEMYMCGNVGDPMMAPDCVEIFEYFRECNPKIKLFMNTNGGARKPEFWHNLAKVIDRVTFSIDGLEDTNHIYRKGVSWYNVMNNVQAFLDAGGRAKWDYLVFAHNEHQIAEAESLSKELGFESFVPKATSRYDKSSNAWQSYWRGKKMEVIEPPKGDGLKGEVMNNPIRGWDSKLSLDLEPKCLKNKEVYVDATGNVWPCCWAHTPWISSQNLDFEERFDIIEQKRPYNINAIDVGLEEAMKWFYSFSDRWGTDNQPYICSNKCNKKQDTVKLQYL